MLKVHILATCSHCNGEAYQPIGEAEDCHGHKYTRYVPCPICEGSGNESIWVNMPEFIGMLKQAQCPHEHTSFHGSVRFIAGDIWDDLEEVCDDCGESLDKH
jgi:hypothetical protein